MTLAVVPPPPSSQCGEKVLKKSKSRSTKAFCVTLSDSTLKGGPRGSSKNVAFSWFFPSTIALKYRPLSPFSFQVSEPRSRTARIDNWQREGGEQGKLCIQPKAGQPARAKLENDTLERRRGGGLLTWKT